MVEARAGTPGSQTRLLETLGRRLTFSLLLEAQAKGAGPGGQRRGTPTVSSWAQLRGSLLQGLLCPWSTRPHLFLPLPSQKGGSVLWRGTDDISGEWPASFLFKGVLSPLRGAPRGGWPPPWSGEPSPTPSGCFAQSLEQGAGWKGQPDAQGRLSQCGWGRVPAAGVQSQAKTIRRPKEMPGAQTLRWHSFSGPCKTGPSGANHVCRTAQANNKRSGRWASSVQ